MPARILDGKSIASSVRKEIAAAIAERTAAGLPRPGLVTVLVGDNPASHVYVRNKRKACDEVGIAGRSILLPESTTQAQLLAKIDTLNRDDSIHGILVQLPLPRHIDESTVILAIDPAKDVDAFHPDNVGRLMAGLPRFYPCTPHGCVQILKRSGIETAGKSVVVIGRSNIVGKPVAIMLLQKATAANPMGGDATVTVAHSKTPDLKEVCRRADILIAAIGVAGFVTPDFVKPGATVIDVGINSVDGKVVGDCHPDVSTVAGALTPVPGGVGPMTIAMLLLNTLTAAK
ncbi:MAG: bifunctional 5,10-methylenetetrahydrofolate dehydrogenase/5,10-methenyltetrahydrofolate cyclohydrolase [Gemmataceae bacterium]